jgi:glycosyltransferase involved in cell wall biosynthesis
MKIAFVLPGIGVERRGAEAFVSDLAAALSEREGFEVTVFCRGEPPLPHRKIRALPRDTGWVNRLYRATRLGRKGLDTLFLDPLSLEWYTAALSAFPHLWRRRFDVLVMEGGLVGAWLARLLRRLRGTAFVDVAHGLDPKWEGAFARQRPDRVVVFTEAAARQIRRLAPRAAVTVIPHGIDLERYHPMAPKVPDTFSVPKVPDTFSKMPDTFPKMPDTPAVLAERPSPVVLAVGAVDAHKRLVRTVEAVAALERSARLVILGDGPEAAAVDRRAAELLPPQRYLRRVVQRQELPAWYRAADVFTLPSVSESFGLVYIEALACGTPVVAPDDDVRREVIGEAGVFCDVEDPQAYAAALAAALDREWGGLPRRRAETFPFTATADAYARLFQGLRRAPGEPEEAAP